MIAFILLFIFAAFSTENETEKKICCNSKAGEDLLPNGMKFGGFEKQAKLKILGSVAQLTAETSSKVKAVGEQRRKLEPRLSTVFPNETAVRVFQDVKTNRISWEDPNNLVDHQMRAKIGICLQQIGEELSNCLFDVVSEWFHTVYYIPESKLPFIKELLFVMSKNCDVERRTELNRTPLFFAARFDAEKAVAELIKRSAKLEAVDEFSWTALHSAANNGASGACRILLENGANVDSPDEFGSTPLMYAANYGYVKAVEVLLDFKADAKIKNKNGESAIDRATPGYGCYAEVIEALKAKSKQKNKF